MRKKTFPKMLVACLLTLTLTGIFGFFQQAFADTPVGSSDKGDGTYTNPVIWADVPDQDVIRVGNAFYMSSTTMHMNPGVPIMKSYDMINWETISYCYMILDDRDATTLKNNQNMYSNGTWASSLRYKDGTFYVVVPSPTTGKTYIFQTEDPENQPWRRYEINTRYHDCGLLLDDDGRNWLVYGGNPLYIIELNDTVTGIKEGATAQVILQNIHAPDPVTGVIPTSGLAEGAHIQKIDGKYYIFCITWPSGKPRTEVCHRSDSLNGPFEAKVVAQEDVRTGSQGGGLAQGGIVDDGNGNWYGFLFRDSGSVGRIPWVMPIHWSNGWPMFGDDDTGLHMTRSGEKPIKGSFDLKSVVASDEFDNTAKKPVYNDAPLTQSLPEYAYNGSNLNLAWQWNHNPDNRFWSLTDRPGWLRLTTGQMATNLLDARNTLSQRTIGPTSSVQTALDVTNMKNGDRAGLSLFTARYGTIEVRMDNGEKTLVMVNSSSTTAHTDVASIPLTANKVFLKIDADFRDQTDKGTFFYSFDGQSWAQLGNTQQMAYSTSNHFMGYRFALYNFATTTLGGYVDYDYFRISDELKGTNIDTTLKDLTVNGTQVSGFSPAKSGYSIAVSRGSAVPQVTATPNDPNAIIDIKQASAVPGAAEITVSVAATTVKYSVYFGYAPKSDNLMDGTMDSDWTILNPDPANYSLEDGKGLRLPTQDHDIYSTARDWTNVFVRPAAGDWDVESSVYFPEVPSATYQQQALLAWQDEDNYVKVACQYNWDSTVVVLMMSENAASATSVASAPLSVTQGAPLQIYYRIKKAGSSYTGYYSLDGTNYTTLGTATVDLNNTQIGVFATKNSTNPTIDTYCQYIKVLSEEQDPAAVLSCPASVEPGSSFAVGISLDNLEQSVYAQDITLTYDSNVFEYLDAEGANSNIQIAKEDDSAVGKVRLIAANIGGVSGASTQVLNASFKVKAGVQNTTGGIAITQAKLGNAPQGTVLQAGLDSKSISIGGSGPVVDKAALVTAINNAQSLYDAAVVGTQPGQYPQTAKDILLTAINTAKAVRDNASATQTQVDGAVTALNNAVDAFKAAAVKDTDLNKDGSIDVGDLAIVAYHYNKDSNSSDWATAKVADINGDNRIDISDLAYVASTIAD